MSLAALLMGVANRAGEVNRQKEQRQYNETLAGKQAQSQYLMQQIADPSLPDEERQQYEDSFEKLHKLPKGIVSFGRQMHQPLTRMIQQHAPQLAPSMEQTPMPSAPAQPSSPAGEPQNVQPPLGALPRPTPTLGMPPSPPPAMQEPNTELGRRQIQQNELMRQYITHLHTLGLIPEDERAAVQHALGIPPTMGAAEIRARSAEEVARMNNVTKLAIAQQNLKQGSGPVFEYQPETGPAVPVRQIKGGGWMDAVTGETYTPKTGDVLTHVGDKTKWFVGTDGQPRAISEKAIQTRQERTGTSAATMGFQVPLPQAKTNELTPYQQASLGSRSYEARVKEINKIADPLRERMGRIDRMYTTLNANSAAADPEIAPELLTIMAGGQYSGLRLNEASIMRSVGGRSNWQALQAKLNQWRTKGDPQAGLSVDPIQRQQIRDLIGMVADKMHRKLALADAANEELINAGDDTTKHKKITTAAKKAMDEIDMEGAKGNIEGTKIYQGYVYRKQKDGTWKRGEKAAGQ